MRSNLDLHFGPLADEIASMSHEELEASVGVAPGMLHETESADGGAKDSDEIVIVGFDVAVLGGAVVVGSIGMNEANLEFSLSKGAYDDQMITSGHFHADDQVLDVVLLDREFEGLNCLLEIAPLMFDNGGFDENSSVEVGEEPLGSGLRAVDADDTEVFGAHHFDSRLNHARRLADDGTREGFGTSLFTLFASFNDRSHDACLSNGKRCRDIPKHGSKRCFFKYFRYMVFRTTYQGMSPIIVETVEVSC